MDVAKRNKYIKTTLPWLFECIYLFTMQNVLK